MNNNGLGQIELKYSYLAGMVDADGCIQIVKRKDCNSYSLRLSVSQVCEIVPYWLLNNFGGKVCGVRPQEEYRRKSYRWYCEATTAMNLIEKMLPYLVLKKERGMVAIKLQTTINENKSRAVVSESINNHRENLYFAMKELNKSSSRLETSIHKLIKEV